MRRGARAAGLAGLVLVVSVAGCSSDMRAPSAPTVTPSAVPSALAAAIAGLPADLRDSGVLTIATDPVTRPGSYRDSAGRVIGWEVELAERVAERLGLRAQIIPTRFGDILLEVSTGGADVGVSSIFDIPQRRDQVSLVDYFAGGTDWVGPTASEITPDTACGARVAVLASTFQATTDLPQRSMACQGKGRAPITINAVGDIATAVEEIKLGRIDAIAGDSPTMDNVVRSSRGALRTLGPAYDVFPYGMAVGKSDTGLQAALLAALESMRADGSYDRLLAKWGVEDGALTAFGVNGKTG